MAFKKADYTPNLIGNILNINGKPCIKAADARGQIILENIQKMLKGSAYQQVTLSFESATSSWVDAKYKHVLFALDVETAQVLMEEYLISGANAKPENAHVAGLDYALATDGGVAIATGEGNVVNASESKRRVTTSKPKTE